MPAGEPIDDEDFLYVPCLAATAYDLNDSFNQSPIGRASASEPSSTIIAGRERPYTASDVIQLIKHRTDLLDRLCGGDDAALGSNHSPGKTCRCGQPLTFMGCLFALERRSVAKDHLRRRLARGSANVLV